jgi:hypothetical protein
MAPKPHNVRVQIPQELERELGLTDQDKNGLKNVINAQFVGYAAKSSGRANDPPLQETNITSVGKRKSSKKSAKASSKKGKKR